ncbi:hypothetical protein Taro_015590 [Colocasia esculenta]|uniref:Uncharacterized protein n=1 Tax=Colocasia esculenta TaxID=4460 RepID=A0A843UMM7_COLES|nr:hypothetical protein [Colocasia esculenta]
MWTFRVAVAIGGRGVDANLRILQVIGSPEGRFSALLSIPLAPACCPSVPKASNRTGLGFLQGLRPENLASRSLVAKLTSQEKISGMVDRRDWGGGGDDPEESTQRMIERIWESLTDIRARMDQQAPVPPVAVPPGDGETVPVAPVPPRVEVLKGAWKIVECVASPNCARKRRDVVQFSWELAEDPT